MDHGGRLETKATSEYGATLGMRQLHRICWYPIRALPEKGVNQGGTAGTEFTRP